jgi:hypothetical protein
LGGWKFCKIFLQLQFNFNVSCPWNIEDFHSFHFVLQIMSHEGGHLPFEHELKPTTQGRKAKLVVQVNNTLTPSTLPPGRIKVYDGSDHFHPRGFTVQLTEFDFCRLMFVVIVVVAWMDI